MSARKLAAYHKQIPVLQAAQMLTMAIAGRAAQASQQDFLQWERQLREKINPHERKVIPVDAVASFIKGLGRR